MNLKNLLSGFRILEEANSPYNGKLLVIQDIAWGTYIQTMSPEGNRLTQSGGIIDSIWKTTIPEIKKQKVENCLILGLGGGSAAKAVRDRWPNAKITGVEIDQTMIDLAKKHLGLDELGIYVEKTDALDYCKDKFIRKKKYDLIIVDLFNGREIPKKFTKEHFLTVIKGLLEEEGVAVFNRLYGLDERVASQEFGEELRMIFKNIDPVYPEANVMFLVYNI